MENSFPFFGYPELDENFNPHDTGTTDSRQISVSTLKSSFEKKSIEADGIPSSLSILNRLLQWTLSIFRFPFRFISKNVFSLITANFLPFDIHSNCYLGIQYWLKLNIITNVWMNYLTALIASLNLFYKFLFRIGKIILIRDSLNSSSSFTSTSTSTSISYKNNHYHIFYFIILLFGAHTFNFKMTHGISESVKSQYHLLKETYKGLVFDVSDEEFSQVTCLNDRYSIFIGSFAPQYTLDTGGKGIKGVIKYLLMRMISFHHFFLMNYYVFQMMHWIGSIILSIISKILIFYNEKEITTNDHNRQSKNDLDTDSIHYPYSLYPIQQKKLIQINDFFIHFESLFEIVWIVFVSPSLGKKLIDRLPMTMHILMILLTYTFYYHHVNPVILDFIW